MTKEIKTPRVFWRKGKKTMLCPLEMTDVPVLYRGINHPDTYHFLLNTQPRGLQFQEEWIARKQKPDEADITVAVCLLDGTLIGTMGLHHIDQKNRTAVTGSVIFDETHRNQGFGTDAKMILLDYAFNVLCLHLIESRVIGFNGRSAAYSRKCGYKEDARLRSRHLRFGERHDEIVLSVVKDDWWPLWQEYQKEL